MRGFRHTLFLLLQVGVAISGVAALILRPDAWTAIAICVAGSWLASLVCERIAAIYLRRTLGKLRRVAENAGQGRHHESPTARRGDDFYKLVNSINHIATRLDEAASEQQRLQDELRRKERLAFLGELAATVAHEVNNPLDGVQNCSRILRRSLDDPQRTRQMLDLIDSGLARISLIVRRWLTLARENVMRLNPQPLRPVIESACASLHEKLTPRGIRLNCRFESSHDTAAIDEALLEQVFVNLLDNAADSMPAGGTIDVTLRRPADGDALLVEVADRGCGIAAEHLPHIFEPFYSTKGGGKGTGLGLAIASRIVDAHRGSIEVRPRDGGGMTFRVSLPAALPGEPPKDELESPADDDGIELAARGGRLTYWP
jgi:signal transduction histidine kinase